MKTRAKKFAALLMAAVITTAMVIPAFAATDPVTGTNDAAITEMTFDKVVEADEDTYQPRENISFTVTPVDPTTDETAGTPAISVVKGVAGGVSFGGAIATNPELKGDQTYNGKFTFTKTAFTQPGIYKYLVQEEALATNPDMKLAADQNLYVYVRWTDAEDTSKGCEVYAASLVDTDDTATNAKSGAFTNVYKNSNKDDDDSFKDLTIEKKVSGAQGDTSKLFSFTLTITSGSDRLHYVVSTTANSSAAVLDSGTAYTFQLKHGEKIVVENLSTNDTYMITETESGQDGYTTTGEVTTATNMPNTNKTVTIENSKNAVNPTGLFVDYAPYIAMIAAAAVLAFVFLRRKETL